MSPEPPPAIDERLNQLITDEKSRNDIKVFSRLYQKFLSEPATIDWNTWSLPPADKFKDSKDLPELTPEQARHFLKKLAVVRLNGGLGTTMGCSGPKSLIKVKNGRSFLEIAVDQIQSLNEKYGSTVPLMLMESFNTLQDSTKAVNVLKDSKSVEILQFEQAKCPRIYTDSLLPVPTPLDLSNEGFYPPGHGNIFQTLLTSGLADELICRGIEVIFVSNIDNTGATVDPRFVKILLEESHEYLMEVTPKTQADIKGGTLIEINGKLMHLEMPQVPPEGVAAFCSTETFEIFNTNNIWIDLKAIRPRLAEIESEIIANKKKLSNGREIIQLETSIGGAIRNFDNACGLRVDRSRFLPVKRTQDLLALYSNAFEMDSDNNIRLLKTRQAAPVISTTSEYNELDGFSRRFEHIPDMSELDSLTIKGDVYFGPNVVLKGNVELIVATRNAARIENVVVENETVQF